MDVTVQDICKSFYRKIPKLRVIGKFLLSDFQEKSYKKIFRKILISRLCIWPLAWVQPVALNLTQSRTRQPQSRLSGTWDLLQFASLACEWLRALGIEVLVNCLTRGVPSRQVLRSIQILLIFIGTYIYLFRLFIKNKTK